MKILVTGGSGSVGSHLKKYLPDAVYLSSSDCNLLSQYQIDYAFEQHDPDVVIHLAALVGGLEDNLARPLEFYEDNIQMNTNIIRGSYQHGVKNFLGVLSTCIYPDLSDDSYPLVEGLLNVGPPPESNRGYAYSKRMMALHLDLYKKQYNLNYGYFIPCNLYSEFDKSDETKSHFVTALLHKIAKAHANGDKKINLLGTGAPLRQFMYSDDLARAIANSINHDKYENCNVCVGEVKTIKEIAELALEVTGLDLDLEFSGSKDGQFRKDASNEKFMNLNPDFKFTPLAEGLKLVYDKISKRYN